MKFSNFVLVICVSSLCASCGQAKDPFDLAQYEIDTLEWRAERVENLKGPDGFLNLAGLFWLSPGVTTIGSASDNDIVFPLAAADHVGELQVSDQGVILIVENDVDVRVDNQLVQTVLVADDTTDAAVTVTHASIVWIIIKRDNRFALRLRDYEHTAIVAFPPIEYYPINSELRVSAELHRFAEPKVLQVDTVIEGLGWQPESPGVVVFELENQTMQLEAYSSGDELFFVFGDRTSGRETYPAGRFLYAELPADGELTVLDFNRAYNPPCAFNDFATCPVAAPQNRLSVRIEAGEKFDPMVHSIPDADH